MVLANLADGTTRSFDLRDQKSLRSFSNTAKTDHITALAIHHDGVQQVLPTPKRFRSKPKFGAELIQSRGKQIAERIFTQVGPVRVSLTRTFASSLIRVDVVWTGKQIYTP